MRHNGPLSATEEELRKAGIIYVVEQGKKHYKVKADGLPLIVCSVSALDRLGEANARSLVKRLIRENRARS